MITTQNLGKILMLGLVICLAAGCAPSINPALKSRIDRYQTTSLTKTYKTDQIFKKPIPWAAGQFVVTRSLDDKSRPTIQTISIINEAKDGWVIEIHSMSYFSESLAQIYVSGFDKGAEVRSMADLDVKWTKIKNADGTVTKVEGNALSFAQSLEQSGVMSNEVRPARSEPNPISVPAGQFVNATIYESKGKIGGFIEFTSKAWFHPDVPIFGSVLSNTSTPKTRVELIKFGLSGAQTKF